MSGRELGGEQHWTNLCPRRHTARTLDRGLTAVARAAAETDVGLVQLGAPVPKLCDVVAEEAGVGAAAILAALTAFVLDLIHEGPPRG